MMDFKFTDQSVPCIVISDSGYLVLNATGGVGGIPLWTYSLQTASVRNPEYPFDYRIARVAVKANEPITFKLSMQTASANLYGAIGVRGGLVAGVNETVSSPVNGAAMQDVSVTVTPTSTGVLEVFARCYSGGLAGMTGDISFNNFRVA